MTALLPYFPSVTMHQRNGYEGFVRLVNFGTFEYVTVAARDDRGQSYEMELMVPGRSTVHFNSQDLEQGNPSKGIHYGGIDASTGGPWSLCIESLNVKATSYVRSDDGFLTEATLQVQGRKEDPCVDSSLDGIRLCTKWIVPIFNPGYNTEQVSVLRLLNNTNDEKVVEIRGTRTDGTSTFDYDEPHRVLFALGASQGVTLKGLELETGNGLAGKVAPAKDLFEKAVPVGTLGRARGKWVIEVFADTLSPEELVVMNLLYAVHSGRVVNLSANADDAITRRKDYNERDH